jgi:hypothetical protein
MQNNSVETSNQIAKMIEQVQGHDSGVACRLLFQFLSEQKDHGEMHARGVSEEVVKKSWEKRKLSLTKTYSGLLRLEGWTILTKTKKSDRVADDTKIDFGNLKGQRTKVFDFREFLTLTQD